ncbi:MAG: helix-turn-helix transcriptional regulator, partial [Arenicella sp.]|nr:helix-turn-helix transcriptional regulator [Arenicella sp.]
ENYLSNLKISDYAILTGRSDSTFNRDFKRLFGTTPKKWLITKRLSKSHQLLCNTELNVTQVAIEVGYENVSHFIAAYKKTYGVTPKSTLTNK